MASPVLGLETLLDADEITGSGRDIRLPEFAHDVTPPTFGLYWRTLRHLRGSQVGYLALRRLLGRRPLPRDQARATTHVRLRRLVQPGQFPEWQPALARYQIATGEFRFLNLNVPSRGRIPWSAKELPRLWIYHLNYCDFLNVALTRPQQSALLRAAIRVMLDWCEQNPTGVEPGWEPYPLSLRVVNWLKFLARNAPRAEALGEGPALSRLLASLRIQALALERRLEKDLLANHLLKNIKTLMFAGALLEVPESRRWWAKGERLLRREIAEQVLADGGHFERSPMYHAQVLEDLLDLQTLGRCVPPEEAGDCVGPISTTAARMAGYLGSILHPDGEVPLFNDSAFGVARPSLELLGRAEQSAANSAAFEDQKLRIETRSPTVGSGRQADRLSVFPDTGYAVIRDAGTESCLVFDCGPLGPDYQPGHGHCDVLSYELSLHGQRVVVDTGVSTYEPGRERQYERSMAAHNTVRIDGEDQAEIWGSFRVGRRPRVGGLSVGEAQGIRFARGECAAGSRGVVHLRTIFHTPANCWIVVDCLRGHGLHRAESFVHFHPAVQLEPCTGEPPAAPDEPGGAAMMRRQAFVGFGGYRYLLMTMGTGEGAVTASWYSPEFGLRLRNDVVYWTWAGRLPHALLHAFMPMGTRPPSIRLVAEGRAIEVNRLTVPLE